MSNQLKKRSLLNSLGVVIYIFGVATLMNNGGKWFGEKDTFLTAVMVLLLFCVSAAVVGGLVLGYPLMLFLNGEKREAVSAAIMTIACLAGELVLVMVAMWLIKPS